MNYFSWLEPITAGDKVPHSPDDKPCGDGWITKEKDCHDGKAHRPTPGENPYWSGDNSAENRRSWNEPWYNTKPKRKGGRDDQDEPKQKPRQERDTAPREQKEDFLKAYKSEQEKATDPRRQTKDISPDDVKYLGTVIRKGITSAEAFIRGVDLSTRINDDAIAKYGPFFNKLGRKRVNSVRDLERLQEKLSKAWEDLKQMPGVQRWLENAKVEGLKQPAFVKNIPDIENALHHYNFAKREDDPRDILKWNTLETKPEMMRFEDIPDLAWKGMPEGPQSQEDEQYIKGQLEDLNKMFQGWVTTGGKSYGAELADILYGKTDAPMLYGKENSPLLPNPKAAKIILEKSAKAGDEEANDSMWYDFGISEEWTSSSYIHDYKKATAKATTQLKSFGVDQEQIKGYVAELKKRDKEHQDWLNNRKPKIIAINEELDKLEAEKAEIYRRKGRTPLDKHDLELDKKEKQLLNILNDMAEEKTSKIRSHNEFKKAWTEKLDKVRNNLLGNLVKANADTMIDEETFGRIANSFANIEFKELNPKAKEYKTPKGKKRFLARQKAREQNLQLKNQEDIEGTLSHFLSILHKDLTSPERDPANGDLTEISWKYDASVRASANKFNNTISLDINETANVAIHEFSHHLEYRNQRVHQRILDFYEDRTKGEKATSEVGYDREEKFKKGRFFHIYAGKDYSIRSGARSSDPRSASNPHTELLSMGMEALYNPTYFAKMIVKDPEHLALIFATLRGY